MSVDDPGAGHGHDEGADLDLTPRTRAPAAAAGRRRRGVVPWVVLALVAVGIGALLTQLRDATLYFYNADEAVARRDDLDDRSFRIQGSVVTEAVNEGETVTFTIAHDGVEVPVESTAGPPELFAVGLPVVLEGRFAEGSTTFLAHNILVKHSEEYQEENPDNVDDFVGEESTP